MLNTIKILVLTLTLTLLTITTNAWADRNSRDDGRSHHWHGFHAHANPDLTLVSGMDNIDTRVLVDPAADPAPGPEVIYEPVPVSASVPVASQPISSDADGNFVVNVPNNQGGYTPIRIQKFGNGFVGPQGEFYYPFPQITQLKAMYGI